MTEIEKSYCLCHRHVLPDRYPVQHRRDLAVRRPVAVAVRHNEQLVCGCEHDGLHIWPDGDAVEAEQVVQVNRPVE